MTRWLLAFAALAVLTASARGEEGKPPPGALNVLLDNERVRVTEIKIKPGARLPLEGRAYQFVYMLTDGSLVFSPPGKMPFELSLQAGEVSLLPSQSSGTENSGEREVRAVVVELKEGGSRKAAEPHKSSRGRKRR